MAEEKSMFDNKELRGMSNLDRLAMRVVSGVLIAGTVGIITLLQSNSTRLAVLQAEIQNLVKTTTTNIIRLDGNINDIEEELNGVQNNRYTYRDSITDKQNYDLRFEKLERQLDDLRRDMERNGN